jgi:hypothetical protein
MKKIRYEKDEICRKKPRQKKRYEKERDGSNQYFPLV